MAKTILKYCFLLFLIVGLFLLIKLSNGESGNTVCSSIEIEILNSDSISFINEADVEEVIKSVGLNPIGKSKSEIDIQAIEDTLKDYKFLEYAECVLLNDNILRIKVKQIVPIMRVLSASGSYYVNKEGKYIKTDIRYPLNVPVVHLEFEKEKLDLSDIKPLIDYINESEELSEFVTDIIVKDKNNILIVPNIRGHIVNLGSVKNIGSKFQKLKRFYKEVVAEGCGWLYYDTISVKWDNQIVATRHTHEHKVVEEFDDETDEADADPITMTIDDSYLKSEDVKAAKQEPKAEKKEEAKTEDKKVKSSEKDSGKKSDKKESEKKESEKKKSKKEKTSDNSKKKKK